MHQEPSRPMRRDAGEEAEKSLYPQGATKGQQPGITGRITHHAAYLDIYREPTCREQVRGGNRWRAGELRQIGGEGVMSRRGENGMTGSGGGAGAG